MKEVKKYQIWVPCILAVAANITGGITHNLIFHGIGLFFIAIQFYILYIMKKRYKDELKKIEKDIEYQRRILFGEVSK